MAVKCKIKMETLTELNYENGNPRTMKIRKRLYQHSLSPQQTKIIYNFVIVGDVNNQMKSTN